MRYAIWLGLGVPGLAHAGLVFNEINADPDVDASCSGGVSTTGDEFVELVNVGPGSVDLTGATFSDLTGVQYTFGSLVLLEGESIVLFGGDVPALDGSATGVGPWCVDVGPDVVVLDAGGSLSLNNGGDDLEVVASDGFTSLAFVSYGSTAGDNQSLVLSPELYGSAYVKHGTVGLDTISPGRMIDGGPIALGGGGSTGGGACDPPAPGVVINEFVANPSGTDTDLEWVEILNGSGGPIDLSGWAIASGTSSYGLGDPFPGGTVLPDGAYLVVGQTALPEVDLVAGGFTLGNASTNSDAVQLRDCVGAVADTVVYGDPNKPDLWLDDNGVVAVSTAPGPPDGGSLARDPDGVDTDDSGSDFIAVSFPTPGDSNDAPPPTCGGPESGIKINELMPNPEGADEGSEWVEVFHAGSDPVDLTDWAIEAGTSSFSTKFTWLGGTLNPGDRLLLGGKFVAGVDEVVDFGMGNASSSSDGLRLVDCFGFPADTVIYGSPNDSKPPFTDDTGGTATSLAPSPGEGASLQRVEDGYDTDQSAIDFAITTSPTPGEPNEPVEPVVCDPTDGSIRINEFVPDPDGEDSGLEWVELHNSSGSDVSVAGWGIAAGTSDYESRDISIGGGVVVPAGGFVVIGGAEVEEADVVLSFSLGNGTDTDGLRLFDCEDTVVDTVLYGDEGNEDLMLDDNGEVVEPYGDPGSAESLARNEDGVDTDTAEDWTEKARPTPGESNVVEVGPIEDPISGGCGCGGGGAPDAGTGPQAEDPDSGGGCSTSPVPPGAIPVALVVLMGIARRRRR